MRWPRGKRCAAAFTFDFDAEEVWIGEDPANAERPGILSQGTYGAKVAIPLILDVLARNEVTATFFVPGRVAERHPDRVREIVEAGHELAHHGYTHRAPTMFDAAEEETEPLKRRQGLASFGASATGDRPPARGVSAEHLRRRLKPR